MTILLSRFRVVPEKKDAGREDGNPYSNMWAVGYDIFEILLVVGERKKNHCMEGCIGSD